MKFHIKERGWTLREEFNVRDEKGEKVFRVKGRFFHIGDNLELIDLHQRVEAAHIKQKILSVTPHYDIYQNDALWANLHEKLLHLFGERFKIALDSGEFYHIDGNIWDWDFTVTNDHGDLLAQIGKKISLFEDSYGVDIAQNVDVPLMIALAITIEMIREHHSDRSKK